jgi:hypothetical protein
MLQNMIGDEQSKRLPTTVPAATLAQFKTEAEKIILAMDAHRPSFLKEPRFCLLAPSDFCDQVEYYLNHPEERRCRAQRLRSRVLSAHTFEHRAEVILAKIKELDRRKHGTDERAAHPIASTDANLMVEATI